MKTRKWPLLLMAILTVLSMSSCQDWGEADPPAGNQKLPAKPDTSAKLIAEFTFDEDFNSTATEGETPVSGACEMLVDGKIRRICITKGKCFHS